jgi:hypothetical protein
MEIREMINKINNFGKSIAYTCLDGTYDKNNKVFDYFAVNLAYAKPYGDYCYMVTLDTSNYKVLNLGIWNKIYKDKTGLNGHKYNRNQGIFVIGEDSLGSGYEEPITRFRHELGDELANKFLDEFNSSDAIYGEDAGQVDDFVYAVKNKNMVVKIEILS